MWVYFFSWICYHNIFLKTKALFGLQETILTWFPQESPSRTVNKYGKVARPTSECVCRCGKTIKQALIFYILTSVWVLHTQNFVWNLLVQKWWKRIQKGHIVAFSQTLIKMFAIYFERSGQLTSSIYSTQQTVCKAPVCLSKYKTSILNKIIKVGFFWT